jgi:hypothetical protein
MLDKQALQGGVPELLAFPALTTSTLYKLESKVGPMAPSFLPADSVAAQYWLSKDDQG